MKRFPGWRFALWAAVLSSGWLGAGYATPEEAERLLARGDYAAALPKLLELKDQHENPETEAGFLSAAAFSLALGQTYRQLGNQTEAGVALKQAESILRQHASPALLGNVLVEMSELASNDARTLLEEAWQVWRQCPDLPELAAAARLRLAEQLMTRADYHRAREALVETRAWLERPAAQKRPECERVRGRLLHDEGRWALVMGDFPSALVHFTKALEMVPKSPEILSDRALALWRAGQAEDAESAFQLALEAAPEKSRDAILANHAAALLSWISSDSDPALLLEQTARIAAMLKPSSVSALLTLAEAERLQALAASQLGRSPAEAEERCRRHLETLEKRGDFQALATNHSARRHAAITRWALEAVSHPEAAEPFAKAALESGLAQISGTDGLATESAKLAFLNPLDLTSPLLALPEAGRISFLPRVLGALSLAGRERMTEHSLEAWQATLPPHSCLLAYVTFRRPAGTSWLNSVAVAVIPPTGLPRVIDLKISAVNLLRTTQQLRDGTEADAGSIQNVLEKLGRQLWVPVQSELPAGTQRAFVFLEGALTGIPLAFLRDGRGSVLEGSVMMTFLGAPECLFHQAAENLPLRPGLWLGVDASEVPRSIPQPVGGWEFPYTVLANRDFAKLTNVGAELSGIASFQKDRWKLTKPTEAELRRELATKSYRVWHFAGHGVADTAPLPMGASPYANALLCREVDVTLAPEKDGVLFASELAAMDLSALDLAVFSACDSGRGATQHGEGVFDLARACHQAGVRDVLVSAAPVQDAVAPILMKEFYQRLIAGQDAPQAAWEAQRVVAKQNPSLHATGYFRLIRNQRSTP